jgi:hypothetical protein
MTLTDVASIGSLASGVAVLVSLIFVGVQVMQNTRAIRAQIHQNITDGWIGVCAISADHGRSFAEGLAADEKSFAAMPDEEKVVYMAAIFVFFKHYENMYLQHREGFVRDEDWNAWVSHMFMYWRMPGVQLWWKARRDAFSPEFRNFIETSPRPAMPSQVDIFTQITSRSERVD